MIKDLWLDPDRSTKRYQVAESQCYQSYAKEMKDQKTALRNCAKSVLQKALAARSQKTPQQQEPTAKVRSSSEDTAGELQPVSYEDAFGPEKPE